MSGTSKVDHDELRRLLAAATPGPWRVGEEVDGVRAGRMTTVRAPHGPVGTRRVVTVDQTREHHESAKANVALIVAAVNALPKLLDDAATTRRLVTELRAAMVTFQEVYDAMLLASQEAAYEQGRADALEDTLWSARLRRLGATVSDLLHRATGRVFR